jgi:hypothetical protein
MAKPAASSAPVFRREPEDSCKSVFWSDACVIDNWFCAARDETLFKILSDISKLLWWVSACYPCGPASADITASVNQVVLLVAGLYIGNCPVGHHSRLSDLSSSDAGNSYPALSPTA